MPKKWYCQINQEEVGPLDAAQIKKLIVAGTLTAKHHIRAENGNWRQVSAVPKLNQLLTLIERSRDTEEPEETRPADVAHEQYFAKFTRVRLWVTIFAVLLAGLVYALHLSGFLFEPPTPSMFLKRHWLIRAYIVGVAHLMAGGGVYMSMTAYYLLKAPKDWFQKSDHGKSWIDISRFHRDNVAGFKIAAAFVGLFGLLFAVAGFGNVCVPFW